MNIVLQDNSVHSYYMQLHHTNDTDLICEVTCLKKPLVCCQSILLRFISKPRFNNYQYKVLFKKKQVLFYPKKHYFNIKTLFSLMETNHFPVDCSFSSISGGKFHRPQTLFAGTAMSKSPGRLCCLAKSSIIKINSSKVLFSLLLNLFSSPMVEHVLP